MSDYLRTLFHLAEASDFYDDDEARQAEIDERSSQQYRREEAVTRALHQAVKKLGLNLAETTYAINYIEDDVNEATIKLDDELSLPQVTALGSLGTDLKVSASHEGYLIVTLRVHKGLSISESETVFPGTKRIKTDDLEPKTDDDKKAGKTKKGAKSR